MITRAGGLNVIVLAVAFVADNEGHIAGVAFDTVMAVYFDVTVLQLGFELVGAALQPAVLGDDNASHIEALVTELLYQAGTSLVVEIDAQVGGPCSFSMSAALMAMRISAWSAI